MTRVSSVVVMPSNCLVFSDYEVDSFTFSLHTSNGWLGLCSSLVMGGLMIQPWHQEAEKFKRYQLNFGNEPEKYIITVISREHHVISNYLHFSCLFNRLSRLTWNKEKTNTKASHYWPFVGGIHQWLVDSPRKGPVMWCFDVCLFFTWSLWGKPTADCRIPLTKGQ